MLDGEISADATSTEKTLSTGNISNLTTPKQNYEGFIDDIDKSLEGDTTNFDDVDTHKYSKYDVMNDDATYFNVDKIANHQVE